MCQRQNGQRHEFAPARSPTSSCTHAVGRDIPAMWFDQSSYHVRCEWGERGVATLAPNVDAIIIVDILCFSTCVDIGTSHGALVYPYRWKDDSAERFANGIG